MAATAVVWALCRLKGREVETCSRMRRIHFRRPRLLSITFVAAAAMLLVAANGPDRRPFDLPEQPPALPTEPKVINPTTPVWTDNKPLIHAMRRSGW
jgi:hypothetical protein